ncbi:hypothetical protein B9Z65_1458 [Elsinoe australis]|uniref:Uncharacterized protein n=1 Tax=Elsinoe australis TaxID=40998 RepID=A0A2P7YFZ0_9PEZI|nr:hypothetical protein B9Z65_1458 [Elsinoe australis]
MPVELPVLIGTFGVSACVPLIVHIVRSTRRELEDLYDYRRLQKGKSINGQRQRERCRLIRRKMRKAKKYGKNKYHLAKFKPCNNDDHIFWNVDGSLGGPPTWKAMRRGYTPPMRSHRHAKPADDTRLHLHPFHKGRREKAREKELRQRDRAASMDSVIPTISQDEEELVLDSRRSPSHRKEEKENQIAHSRMTSKEPHITTSAPQNHLTRNTMSAGLHHHYSTEEVSTSLPSSGAETVLCCRRPDHDRNIDRSKSFMDSEVLSSTQTSPRTLNRSASFISIRENISSKLKSLTPSMTKKKKFKRSKRKRLRQKKETYKGKRSRKHSKEWWTAVKKFQGYDEYGKRPGYWGFRRGYSATHYDPTHTHTAATTPLPSGRVA